MKRNKYPKINEDNDLRKTLTVRKIIKKLYSIGLSQRLLGRFLGVDKTTIGSYLKSPKLVRNKRYKFKLTRELSATRQDRRNAVIEKMLEWERNVCVNRRKDRKRPYRPVLTIRKIV